MQTRYLTHYVIPLLLIIGVVELFAPTPTSHVEKSARLPGQPRKPIIIRSVNVET